MRTYKSIYILAVVVLPLLLLASLVFIFLTQETQPDPASEKTIRGAAAKQLQKDPNELTDEDYIKITKLDFDSIMPTLADIQFLEKFSNLKELSLSSVRVPKVKKETPKWMILLAKLGIDYKPAEDLSLDLSPLKRLKKLEILNLSKARIKNLKPLASLVSLKVLNLSQSGTLSKTQIYDLKPLKRLTNLENLSLEGNIISDLKPLKGMKNLRVLNLYRTQINNIKSLSQLRGLNNLHVLYLDSTKINNLEPIANLTSLQRLVINDNPIKSLEPVKGLINLRELVLLDTLVTDIEPVKNLTKLTWIGLPKNIADKQIEDLKKALPNLKIDRSR